MELGETAPGLGLYPNRAERRADRLVHWSGAAAWIFGCPFLLGAALAHGGLPRALAVLTYLISLGTTLVISTVSNLTTNSSCTRLQRFDRAAIFILIAGSYTPFTTQTLSGSWAIGMTTAVWTFALASALGRLLAPQISGRFWMLMYLAVGWMIVAAAEPLMKALSPIALALLVAGGLVYSLGTIIYASSRMPFRRAIWHGFVLAAAATHYAAIFLGVAMA